MKTPYFSIIIPTYNRENSIYDCLSSVLNQTFTDFEIILVDNKSTDRTIEKIKQFKDERIKVFINEKNFERCYSRNKGIKNAIGKYITFLDSDDLFDSNHLKNWFEFTNKNYAPNQFYICQKKIQLENNSPSGKEILVYKNPVDFIKNPVIPGQVCIPYNLLKNDQFNTDYLIFEDTALWLELSMKYTFISSNFDSYIYILNMDNSVNVKKNDFGKIRFKSIKNFIDQKQTIVNFIGKKHFKNELSNSLFQSAKYYMANQKKYLAIFYLTKSIFANRSTYQLKHKSYLIFKLLLNKSIDEYYFNNHQ